MDNRDIERAEVFDALGHPVRISILKLLSREPLSFADLKKKTQIDSSGHLQHHLMKLDGLIKTDEHGNYCLSDVGNDALFAMQTVETVSREGKRRRVSYSPKSRMLLSILVLGLAACMVVSTLYLSNYGSSVATQATQNAQNQLQDQFGNLTQYASAIQNEYVCDVMTGSLNEPGPPSTASTLFDLPSHEWFNYTAVILPDIMTPRVGYAFHNSGTYFLPSALSNATYYAQGFLVYNLEIIDLNGADLVRAHMIPIVGPDGWNGQVVWPHVQDIPPYQTKQTVGDSTPYIFSGGAPYYFESIIPVNVFGNYTFALKNDGNATIEVSYSITQPVVTLQTKPLEAATFPAWSPQFAQERIVRIRQSGPLSTAPIKPIRSLTVPDAEITQFVAYTLAILSTAFLTIIGVSAINRRRAHQNAF